MGVTGLWKLIEPSGKAVPLDTLENKILAIDISIWLHQVIKGFQDNKGNALAHAHLLGLFHRLCKLLYYRIKPIFVFDGSVPQLKRDTIIKRQQNRNKILSEADRLQDLLLQQLAKERVVQQALGSTAIELLKSPQKKTKNSEKSEKDDMFKLPELPIILEENLDNSQTSIDYSCNSSDSSFDEKNLRCSYNNQLQSIDVKSKYFLSLPADIRHEILVDIKETRKQSSWGRLHELPSQLPEFSTFQMKRLLKRRQVQVSLEDAEKQMGGKSLTYNELNNFLSEEGIVPLAANSAKDKIDSDENTRFLLIRDLKKAMEKAKQVEELEKQKVEKQEIVKTSSDLDDEDLQLAIQMSLENDAVYKNTDYDYDNIKLNRQQRMLLKDSAKSLAKDYLIEYGGMNEDDFTDLLNNTQYSQDLSFKYNNLTPLREKTLNRNSAETVTDILEIKDSINESKNRNSENEEEFKPSIIDNSKNISTEAEEIGIMSDDTDSDLEIISEKEKLDNFPSSSKSDSTLTSNAIKKMEITIDLTKGLQDDLFADVFSQPTTLSNDTKPDNSEIFEFNSNIALSQKNSNEAKKKNIETMQVDLCTDGLLHQTTLSSDTEPNNLQIYKTESNIIISEKILEETKESNVDITNSKVLNVTEEISNSQEEIESLEKKIEDNRNQENKYKLDAGSPIIFSKIKDQYETIHSKENMKAILNNLKGEVAEIKKLTLDDIKINSTIFEIQESDEEDLNINESNSKKVNKLHNEVIVINDDDNYGSLENTPLKQCISDYFKTNSSTKKSTTKNIEMEQIAKVKSPFFVNKSPKSNKKKENPQHENQNVVKNLFNEGVEETPIINPLDVAADLLRENRSHEQLKELATGLATETRNIEIEKNRQDRMAVGITEKMNRECMELLKLFGIPYICAPMEAEAQCAFLNAVHFTDGTITDDSDIWLFGGQTVYKNFFNQQKHVLEFKIESIEKNFNIDRHKLIQLAFLVGSDYTTGINGIGAVTALEILAAFPSTPIKENEVTETMSILSSLRKFREWYKNGRNIGPGGKTVLKNKLKNIDISEGFPNFSVVEAYLNPKVDKNEEAFSWGTPDIETIFEFTKTKFGWTRLKTDEILKPVLKRLNEKQLQTSIKNYFKVTMAASKKDLHLSKRVQKAIYKMANGNYCDVEDIAPKQKVKKVRKNKNTATISGESSTKNTKDDEVNNTANDKISNKIKQRKTKRKEQSNTTNQELDSEPLIKAPKKIANIPSTSQIIPQREKDKKEMEKKKELAAALFKQTKDAK